MHACATCKYIRRNYTLKSTYGAIDCINCVHKHTNALLFMYTNNSTKKPIGKRYTTTVEKKLEKFNTSPPEREQFSWLGVLLFCIFLVLKTLIFMENVSKWHVQHIPLACTRIHRIHSSQPFGMQLCRLIYSYWVICENYEHMKFDMKYWNLYLNGNGSSKIDTFD